MKTVLLVLLFAGIFVQTKGLRGDEDVEDLVQEAEKRYRGFAFPHKYAVPFINKVNTAINSFYGDAAKRAKRLLQKIDQDWNTQTRSERKLRQRVLEAVAPNIDGIAKAKTNTFDAFHAVLNMIWRLKNLQTLKKTYLDDTLPFMFITSVMNLLGETADPFPVQSIISKEMKNVQKKYENILEFQNQVKTSYFSYLDMKDFLNNLGKDEDRKRLSTDDVERIRLYTSAFASGFPGVLEGHLQKLISRNRSGDAKEFLTYLELYARLETVMEVMLNHALSLIPQYNRSLSAEFLSAINKQQKQAQAFLSVIREPSKNSKFMAYMDYLDYKVASLYSMVMYGYRGHGDLYSGLVCIALVGDNIPWKWSKLPGKMHPCFYKGDKNMPCGWRFVSHGNRLFSIVNKYDCPNGRWCNAMLSFNGKDAVITVEHSNPVIWEVKSEHWRVPGYTFRPRQFCGSMCDCSIGYNHLTFTGTLDCSDNQRKVPQRWRIFQKKGSQHDMANDSESAASTNKTMALENQEDNSTSSEEDNNVNDYSGKDENEIQKPGFY